MPIITLVNEGKTIEAAAGANLRKVLLTHGVALYRGKDRFLNCFGNGLCGTCRVEVVDGKGAPPMTPMEEAALVGLVPFYARLIPKQTRLACRIALAGDIAIKTTPAVSIDPKLTRERIALSLIWAFFGGTLLAVVGRLLLEIATGR